MLYFLFIIKIQDLNCLKILNKHISEKVICTNKLVELEHEFEILKSGKSGKSVVGLSYLNNMIFMMPIENRKSFIRFGAVEFFLYRNFDFDVFFVFRHHKNREYCFIFTQICWRIHVYLQIKHT